LVAAGPAIVEIQSGNTARSLCAGRCNVHRAVQRPGRRGNNLEFIEKKRGAKRRCAAPSNFYVLSRSLIPLANFEKRAQPVVTDESVRATNCNSKNQWEKDA
jgi:hypothetical protein